MNYKRFDAADFAEALEYELRARHKESLAHQQAINEALIGSYELTWKMWKTLFERRDVAGLAAFESTDEFQTALRHRIAVLETSPLVQGLPEREKHLNECHNKLKPAHPLLQNDSTEPSTVATIPSGELDSEETPASLIVAQPTTTINRVETRKNCLSAVIAIARKSAVDPDDLHSCWSAFVALANSPNRPSPLLGYVEEDGVKYQDENGVAFIKKADFIRRLKRADAAKR